MRTLSTAHENSRDEIASRRSDPAGAPERRRARSRIDKMGREIKRPPASAATSVVIVSRSLQPVEPGQGHVPRPGFTKGESSPITPGSRRLLPHLTGGP